MKQWRYIVVVHRVNLPILRISVLEKGKTICLDKVYNFSETILVSVPLIMQPH